MSKYSGGVSWETTCTFYFTGTLPAFPRRCRSFSAPTPSNSTSRRGAAAICSKSGSAVSRSTATSTCSLRCATFTRTRIRLVSQRMTAILGRVTQSILVKRDPARRTSSSRFSEAGKNTRRSTVSKAMSRDSSTSPAEDPRLGRCPTKMQSGSQTASLTKSLFRKSNRSLGASVMA